MRAAERAGRTDRQQQCQPGRPVAARRCRPGHRRVGRRARSRAGRRALPDRSALDHPRPDRPDPADPASGGDSGLGTNPPVIMRGMLLGRTQLTSRIDMVDPEVGAAIRDEYERQQYTLELIPSENIASPAVLQPLGSLLHNKYAEGYPGKRYYGGTQIVDRIETLAIERAKALFGAEHANVQSHCGTTAQIGSAHVW